MGKFRDHTVEEIRRLRNVRQKQKRQQKNSTKTSPRVNADYERA